MEMERKAFPFELEEKGLDLEQGTFAGYAAVCGNLDDGGDIIDFGAFKKTIAERGPDSPRNRLKVFRFHDFMAPIGKVLEIREVPRGKMPKDVTENYPGVTGGLYVKGKVSHTPDGDEVLTLMRDGVVDEMSIGYDSVKDALEEGEEGVSIRHLKEIKLYCCDPVPLAMNPAALVTDVKSCKDTEVGEGSPEEFKPYPNEHACRLKDPGQYDTCRRGERIAKEPESVNGKKYAVIYCKKGDGPMEQQAFRYAKDDWTAEQASAHCEFNDGKFEPAQEGDAEQDDDGKQRQEIEKALVEAGLQGAEIQKELIEASLRD